jgi:hypothetical protein
MLAGAGADCPRRIACELPIARAPLPGAGAKSARYATLP